MNEDAAAGGKAAPSSWRSIPEAGTVLGIRFVVALARLAGRRVAGWFLYGLCLYYATFHRAARRVSAAYLQRMGLPATFRQTLRHLHAFAQTSLDRLFFLTGKWHALQIERHGHELIVQAVQRKTGALLVGAHLGSFEAMRAAAAHFAVPLTIVVDFTNAERVNRVLQSLAPGALLRVISLGGSGPGAAIEPILKIKAAIARGELVAMLSDRRSDRDERCVTATCLGAPARFPLGPWILAHSLGCPVYFVAGLYTKPNRYDLHCELLAERVVLRRGDRAGAAQPYVDQFAQFIDKYAQLAPLNWFNFYDFWSQA
ncbi:MAG: hypothetical protein IPL79_11185 [Myxococcales bacterium]|nr:hypothetical protein [Myxococcales bacterium]